jgi:NAD/NADP transhydrogenase alpha subunit
MPRDASYFFSNNAANYLKLLIRDGELNLDLNNEIIEKTLLIKD